MSEALKQQATVLSTKFEELQQRLQADFPVVVWVKSSNKKHELGLTKHHSAWRLCTIKQIALDGLIDSRCQPLEEWGVETKLQMAPLVPALLAAIQMEKQRLLNALIDANKTFPKNLT